jgi:hypothetical protein
MRLDVPALVDLLLVTYRGARFSAAAGAAALKPLTVTSAIELLCFKVKSAQERRERFSGPQHPQKSF